MLASLRPFPELSGSELGLWRELASRAAEPNPFFEPEFLLASVERFNARDLALAIVERDGRWLAAAPVRTRLRRIWVHTYAFLGTPLVDRDAVAEGAAGLLRLLLTRTAPLVALDTLTLDGPVGAALLAAGGDVVAERRWERPAIDLRATGEWPGLTSKVRSDLRRRRRRLAEELDGEIVTRAVTGDRGAIARFVALEASGWKGREGTALGSDPADVAFFENVCAAFEASGRVEILELGTEDRALAMTCTLFAGDTAFGFKTAYDETYRRQGPGGLLLADTVERFGADVQHRLFDSCASSGGTHLDKVMPDHRKLGSIVLGRGAVGRLTGAGLRTGLALRERVRARSD